MMKPEEFIKKEIEVEAARAKKKYFDVAEKLLKSKKPQ